MVLGQYIHTGDNVNQFMESIPKKDVNIIPVKTSIDLNLIGNSQLNDPSSSSSIYFNNLALVYKNNVFGKDSYYCHGKIKRLNSTQVIDIYLTRLEGDEINNSADTSSEQFIKRMVVAEGVDNGEKIKNQWEDIDFSFTSLNEEYNAIIFILQRTNNDFVDGKGRDITISFLEFSRIKNAISTITGNSNAKIVKMGVQSRPSFRMCINQDEIYTGKTGVFELRNGEVYVDFFSCIAPFNNPIDYDKQYKNNQELNYNQKLNCLPSATDKWKNERAIDQFLVDFIYTTKINGLDEEITNPETEEKEEA